MFRKNPPLVALEVLAKRKTPFVFQFSRRGWLGPIKTIWSGSHLIQVLPGNIHMGRKDLQICMAKGFVWKSCERGHFSGKTCIICTSHIVIYVLKARIITGDFQISKNSTSPQRLANSQVWVGRFWHEMCWVCRAESWSCEQNGTQMMDVNIRGGANQWCW